MCAGGSTVASSIAPGISGWGGGEAGKLARQQRRKDMISRVLGGGGRDGLSNLNTTTTPITTTALVATTPSPSDAVGDPQHISSLALLLQVVVDSMAWSSGPALHITQYMHV